MPIISLTSFLICVISFCIIVIVNTVTQSIFLLFHILYAETTCLSQLSPFEPGKCDTSFAERISHLHFVFWGTDFTYLKLSVLVSSGGWLWNEVSFVGRALDKVLNTIMKLTKCSQKRPHCIVNLKGTLFSMSSNSQIFKFVCLFLFN